MPGRWVEWAGLGLACMLLAGCASPPARPEGWHAPELLVAPSPLRGVHGLAIDAGGRLLAGSVAGSSLWKIDRETGAARVEIPAPQGQADDIAVGPRGELAWTSYLMGVLHYRDSDTAPIRALATGLPGINAVDFDRRNGKLYASQVFLADALWEIDRAGAKPPRLIARDLGGFNGFEVGPDGMLYGPLWFKGQVVKVDPSNGAVTVINGEFKTPAAVNLDGQGRLWVVDSATGELSTVDRATGVRTVVRRLRTSLDNLAIGSDGTVYVSNMADSTVQAYVPSTDTLRTLVPGGLGMPGGLKLDGDALWLADLFALRQIDTRTGEVQDVHRMHASGSPIDYPLSVGVSARRIALASWAGGTVQLLDRESRRAVATLHGLKAPFDALPMPDGSLLYTEIAAGTVTHATGADFESRRVVAEGLAGPVQLLLALDGALYVTEAAGRLTRIDLATGRKTDVASGLALPEGVAQTPWGSFVVAEAAAGRLTEIDADGRRRTVAERLPVGLPAGPGLPPPYAPTGVAVGPDGTVYVSADGNGAIYRIRPRR